MDTRDKPLNMRERAFIREKLLGVSGAEAARRAGYKRPRDSAMALMRRPRVQQALQRVEEKADAKAIITREELERFLADTMRGDSDNPREKIYRTTRLKAAEQLTRLNAWDKTPASLIIPVIGIKIET